MLDETLAPRFQDPPVCLAILMVARDDWFTCERTDWKHRKHRHTEKGVLVEWTDAAADATYDTGCGVAGCDTAPVYTTEHGPRCHAHRDTTEEN